MNSFSCAAKSRAGGGGFQETTRFRVLHQQGFYFSTQRLIVALACLEESISLSWLQL